MTRSAPPHFVEKCRDRVPSVPCPHALFWVIVDAVRDENTDIAEFVKRDPVNGQVWYRFTTSHGRLYAPMVETRDGTTIPATVYTHQMFRRKCKGMKYRKKMRSRQEYRDDRTS